MSDTSKQQDTSIEETAGTVPDFGTRKYFYGLGRRKAAIAQVRLYEKGTGAVYVNNKKLDDYFPYDLWQETVIAPLAVVNLIERFDVAVKVKGGGVKGQSESIRLGVARALLQYDADLRKPVKAKGYLSRDSRVKERKKPGLKGARRSPQWSKR